MGGIEAGEGLQRQVDFLLELDKLKAVERRTILADGSRLENSAEHSWHVAMCAAVLADYAVDPIDLLHVILMLLVHDIVEIDAGDTFAYDVLARRDQVAREEEASSRLFGMLPVAQAVALSDLWREFDMRDTPEAKFANAVDRLMPLLHNYRTQGGSWRNHGITRSQVLERVSCIRDGMPSLWPYVATLVDDSVREGYLLP